MVFSSQIFIFIFLPLSLLGYFILRKEIRNIFLLLISFLFYAWAGPKLLTVLFVSIALNYFCGLLIQIISKKQPSFRQLAVIIAVLLNLGLLGYFKYFNFFIGIFNHLTRLNLPQREIALPLGISFFTFSGISYILDVNAEKIEAEKNPLHFALFMAFFPKLLQGPIARYEDIAPNIKNQKVTIDHFVDGISRFIIGLAKKVLIADQLSTVVNQIYGVPALNNLASVAWLGAISYTLQIYFDFSGYTDMAIGIGKMFGFEIPENFDYPYISHSIGEFWRRWHITLSSWFRDYVFYPLEFKRRKVKKLRVETDTLIVFFLTGLWHGASFNFILWGLWHGSINALENFVKSQKLKLKLPEYIRWLITMLVVIIGWVLFRSPNLPYAWQYLKIMFGLIKPIVTSNNLTWYLNAKIATILVIGAVVCVPWRKVFPTTARKYEGTNVQTMFQLINLTFLLVLSLIYVISSSYNSFIYFKY